jgi:hypothetical protein
MATTEKILAAIEKAKAAGDDAAVEDLQGRLGVGKAESALRGAAKSATLGLGDNIEGLIQAALPVAGDEGSFFDRYRKWRDVARLTDRKAEAANPKSSMAGQIIGGLATAAAPAGLAGKAGLAITAAKDAPLLTRAAIGAANAVPLGAIYAAGEGNAETLGGAAKDALMGGVASGIAGGTVSAVSPPVAAWLKKQAHQFGQKALSGIGTPLAARKELSERATEAAYDVGAITPFSGVRKISQRLDGAIDDLAPKYGAILKELEAAGVVGPDAEEIARNLLMESSDLAANSWGSKIPTMMNRDAMEMAGKVAGQADPRLGLLQAERIKRDLQQQAKQFYAQVPSRVSAEGDYKMSRAALVRQLVEDSIDQQSVLAPEAASRFVPVRDKLAGLYEANYAAAEGAAKAARRGPVGLSSATLAAGVLAGGGGPGGALLTAAGNEAVQARLPSLLGTTARGLSQVLTPGAGQGAATAQMSPAARMKLEQLMEFVRRSRMTTAGADEEQP